MLMLMLSAEFVIWLGKLEETNPDMFYKLVNIAFCILFVGFGWLITDVIYSKKKSRRNRLNGINRPSTEEGV